MSDDARILAEVRRLCEMISGRAAPIQEAPCMRGTVDARVDASADVAELILGVLDGLPADPPVDRGPLFDRAIVTYRNAIVRAQGQRRIGIMDPEDCAREMAEISLRAVREKFGSSAASAPQQQEGAS